MVNRRTFLSGLAATAAGILLPASVLAEPERRIWALDRSMIQPALLPVGNYGFRIIPWDAFVRFQDGTTGVYLIHERGDSWDFAIAEPSQSQITCIRYLKCWEEEVPRFSTRLGDYRGLEM